MAVICSVLHGTAQTGASRRTTDVRRATGLVRQPRRSLLGNAVVSCAIVLHATRCNDCLLRNRQCRAHWAA